MLLLLALFPKWLMGQKQTMICISCTHESTPLHCQKHVDMYVCYDTEQKSVTEILHHRFNVNKRCAIYCKQQAVMLVKTQHCSTCKHERSYWPYFTKWGGNQTHFCVCYQRRILPESVWKKLAKKSEVALWEMFLFETQKKKKKGREHFKDLANLSLKTATDM